MLCYCETQTVDRKNSKFETFIVLLINFKYETGKLGQKIAIIFKYLLYFYGQTLNSPSSITGYEFKYVHRWKWLHCAIETDRKYW